MTKKSGEGSFHALLQWICAVLLLTNFTHASQSFLRQPSNTTVRLGTPRTRLQCAVANKKTSLQWTKDDFGLSWNKFLDPRYSISGSQSRGEFHLQIVNVKLSDDGKYRCQLDPDYSRGIPPLQSRAAFLNVIVPPKKIVLGPSVSGTISVKYPDNVAITCTVPDTKPASLISWRVEGKAYSGQTSEKISSIPDTKLVTTSSTITLRPDKLQNGTTVECIVNHQAMDTAVSRIATLNVMYPPNAPRISKFSGEPVKSGEEVTMKCEATGGNPPATITWLLDGEIISRDFQRTKGGSESLLRYKVRPEDHQKFVTCRAENPATKTPLEEQELLKVYYPPEKIILDQTPEGGASENGVLTLTCSYPHSNPKASLQWFVDDTELAPRWSDDVGTTPYIIRVLDADDSSARTSLTLTSVRRQDGNSKVTCRASIPLIGYSGEVSTQPKINFPPRKVDISVFYLNSPVTISSTAPPIRGFSAGASAKHVNNIGDNVAFKVGDIIQLICQAKGGNPPPDLTWFREGTPITSGPGTAISAGEVKVYTDTPTHHGAEAGEYITTTTLELSIDESHNGNSIACQAGHPGYSEKLSDRQHLNVVFPPRSLSIEQFPSSPVAGRPMSLTCTTTSSFPAAKITWYHNGNKIQDNWSVNLPLITGSNGGFVSASRLQLIAESEDDGTDIICKAEVETIQETVSQPYRIQIQYPPKFIPLNPDNTIDATENDAFVEVKVVAQANPPDIIYSWYRFMPASSSSDRLLVKEPLGKGGRTSYSDDGGYMRISNLKREDGGLYQVRATNKRGSAEMNITINVFYSASVTRIVGPDFVVKEGQTTTLRCEFESHPQTQTRVTWLKDSPGKGRQEYEFTTFSSYSVLTLTNITADDRGPYRCEAENGIGGADSAQTSLQVRYAPVFTESSSNKVAVSSVDEDGVLSPPAVLPCIVNSNPPATFKWMQGNETIVATKENRFSILHDPIDFETNKSSLRVTKLRPGDHSDGTATVAEFTCVASSKEGQRFKNIKIVLRGPPDPPTNLSVLNVSDTAIEIAWKRGFDGGVKQEFLVEHKKKRNDLDHFDKTTTISNRIVLGHLDPSEEYVIKVTATNAYGKSKKVESITVTTKAPLPQGSRNLTSASGLPKIYVIAIAVIGGLIFFFVFVIAIVAFKRCNISRHSYKPKTIETDCESLAHAESSLSSDASARKHRDSDGDREEKERLTKNSDRISDSEDQRRSELRRVSHSAFASHEAALQPSCYFDCSLSRCESDQTVERFEAERCGKSSICSFSTSQNEVTVMPTYAEINRFHANNASVRSQRPLNMETVPSLPHNSSEPRFRFDVLPSDLHEKESLLPRPLDLPLPPSLPLYDRPQYTARPGMRASNDTLDTCSYSELTRDGQDSSFRKPQYRPYRTLQPGQARFNQYSSEDCCCPVGEMQFEHEQRERERAALSIASARTADNNCLYNVASRPCTNRNYSCSLSSMQSNAPSDYAAGVGNGRINEVSRNSPIYPETKPNGLYVKSMESMGEPKRPCIVNDDGTINTYGYDQPPRVSESRSTVLDSIRESQSQDPLPCSPFIHSTDQGIRTSSMALPPRHEPFAKYGRRSLRGTSSTQAANRVSPANTQKRDLTPPLRFRDETSWVTSSGRPGGSDASTSQQMSEHENAARGQSDDDMDSGCGGSADAMVVESDGSPQTPNERSNAFAFKSSSEVPTAGELEEAALFV